MNKLMVAALFAATALPGMAIAQDQPRPGAEGRTGWHGGERDQRAQPQAQAQAQPAAAPQLQQQQRPEGQRAGDRGNWRGGGDASRFQQPQAAQSRAVQQDQGGRAQWRGRGDNGAAFGGQSYQGQVTQAQQDRGQQSRGQQDRGDWRGRDDRAAAFGAGQPRADQWNRGQQGFDPRQRGYQGQPAGYGQRGYAPAYGGQYRGQDYRRDQSGRDGYDQGNRERQGEWNRGWHNDRRYDWRDYRADHVEAFRLPRYAAPYGWRYGYRRFSIGVRLDELLFAQDYWIDDPFEYRLPPVDGPYRWVRYYGDALLVDIYSGEVVDTVYGIFG